MADAPEEPPPGESRPAPPPEHLTVMDTIRSRGSGKAARVLLQESAEGAAPSPVIDTHSDARPSRVPGRANYRILGEIARGGMGVVLKGHDSDLGRDFAIKLLHEHLSTDETVLQRFVEEAQIGGQLQHPGIVPVYEMGLLADKRPYFTMKLVKGRTLSELLTERESAQQERRRFLGIFERVCQTMAYAHSRRVVHRDLKPANVMVGAFGEVQIVDWGLAKVLGRGGVADEKRARNHQVSIIETERHKPGSTGSGSMVGSVMGTPAYMPPEQARGEMNELDERSDVFALGAILCEILTGVAPYSGPSDMLLGMAAEGQLGPARERLAACGADPELVALCEQLLAPAPGARPRNAERVSELISAHLSSVEERAKNAQIAVAEERVRAREAQKSRKLTAALATTVVASVLIASGLYIFFDKRQREDLDRASATVEGVLDEAILQRGRGRYDDALDMVQRAQALVAASDVHPETRGRTETLLTELRFDAELARSEQQASDERRKMIDALDSVPLIEDEEGQSKWEGRDKAFHDAFRDFGIDPLELDVEQAARSMDASGMGTELALALDSWAAIRRRHKGAKDPGAERLLRVAVAADADPFRVRMREAVIARDLDTLRELARAKETVDLQPISLVVLGAALGEQNAFEDSVALLREAQRRHPGNFLINYTLGGYLLDMRPVREEEALRFATAARALEPESALGLQLIGRILRRKEDYSGAVTEFREALRLNPYLPDVHADLGAALVDQGDLDGAISEYREMIRLQPDRKEPYLLLGKTLRDKGLFREALEAYEKAESLSGELGKAQVSTSGDRMERLQQEIALDDQLQGILAGEPFPEPRRCAELALVATVKGMHYEAAKLYESAFDRDPETKSRIKRHRAAREAALASDVRELDALRAADLAPWRHKCLEWLREELEELKLKAESRSKLKRRFAINELVRWEEDAAFASVRDSSALARLPEAERELCHAFWARVDDMKDDIERSLVRR